MTLGLILLIVVAAALGLLAVVVVWRVVRDRRRAAHGPGTRLDPNRDTTIAHYGHS